jgi:Protein of unknown function DUF262/HNH endonuclease
MSNIYLNQEQFENIFKNHLKIETYSKPIESLFSLRNRRKIDYKPYYQRNYVWDVNKASYFIESIILGTEIPPLIFFNNGENTEIIDGRQRFETIQLFMDDKIKLKRKGLSSLKHLDNKSFETLPDGIRGSFLDSTLRIIEFEIVNEPRLDLLLQDKVKKEIFGRYNSGITPLKRSEIDNAVYDNDDLSNIFKSNIKQGSDLHEKMSALFFKDAKQTRSGGNGVPIETMMQFIRKNMVLHLIPITYYAAGRKNEIFERLYDQVTDTQTDHQEIFNSFCKKVDAVADINKFATNNGVQLNRLFLECLLWILQILENEGRQINELTSENIKFDLTEYYRQREDDFSDVDYAFYAKVIARYNSILEFTQKKLDINLRIYQTASDDSKLKMKALMADDENKDVLDQLESLRLNKPEPSRTSIEDISRVMTRRKFLVRPSYQRSEVINLPKASSIIESILLGIALPAIFVYKRTNGVSEVIDGQQRILTILSYIGSEYINEEGFSVKPKNSGFTLRSPKILKEYMGKKFYELPESAQEKILDFELFVVSIEEKLNPEFDPIDLFIRLNDKPYPIKEHSFEMWNSWADKEIITAIKSEVDKEKDWFFVRYSDRKNFRDRMENEEIFTSLAYLGYKLTYDGKSKALDIFQKENRLNARIGYKKDISHLLNEASSNEEIKNKLLNEIKKTKSFMKKLRILLIEENISDQEVSEYLKDKLDKIFNSLERTNFRRTFQDFYILWFIISPISLEILKKYRHEIAYKLTEFIIYSKSIPEEHNNGKGYDIFIEQVTQFHKKYEIDKRKIYLSDDQIKNLIQKQNNICPISNTPLYWGDDIEIDHIIPLALGGKDEYSNLQATHKDSNRTKGGRH